MKTNWEKMTGTFRYEGLMITKNGPNDYTVLNRSAKSFGECILIIQEARAALAQSLTRGQIKSIHPKKQAI